MTFSIFDLQCRVTSLGFPCGKLDGVKGPATAAALNAAKVSKGLTAMSPDAKLFHPSGLHRVIIHWTAGAYGANALELNSYHALVLPSARVVYGKLKPEANASTADGSYCAHTLGLNTGSIGIAFDAMGGAVERPFQAGSYPITEAMIEALAEEVAGYCEVYDIPVHPVSVLTHAEVQSTLGRRQRNKWDVTWLPGMREVGDARKVGDILRSRVAAALAD